MALDTMRELQVVIVAACDVCASFDSAADETGRNTCLCCKRRRTEQHRDRDACEEHTNGCFTHRIGVGGFGVLKPLDLLHRQELWGPNHSAGTRLQGAGLACHAKISKLQQPPALAQTSQRPVCCCCCRRCCGAEHQDVLGFHIPCAARASTQNPWHECDMNT